MINPYFFLKVLEDETKRDGNLDINITVDAAKELIRLARLGLWAEERGIPTLRGIISEDCDGSMDVFNLVTEAIFELPEKKI